MDMVRRAEATARGPKLCMGDFKWWRSYDSVVAGGWKLAPVSPTTTTAGSSAPTRCLAQGVEEVTVQTRQLLAVPHHLGVVYTASLPMPEPLPRHRLRRCVSVQWHTACTTAENNLLRLAADRAAAAVQPTKGNLEKAMKAWHLRAEAVLNEAIRLKLAVATSKAERPKGSQPTSCPTANTSHCRPPDSMQERRLLRLHRAAEHQRKREGGPGSALTTEQRRHWKAAMDDGVILKEQPMPRTQAGALEVAGRAHTAAERKTSEAAAKDWRRRFSRWSQDTMQAAAPMLRPPAPPTTFTAADMRSDWQPIWAPTEVTPGKAEPGSGWRPRLVARSGNSSSGSHPASKTSPPP